MQGTVSQRSHGPSMFGALGKDLLAPLVLRLGLAAFLVLHGPEKVTQETDWGARWADKADAAFNPSPAPAGQLGIAWGELAGGAALAAGFLTRLAALAAGAATGAMLYMTTGANLEAVRAHERELLVLVGCL